jgi:hypothetical protein
VQGAIADALSPKRDDGSRSKTGLKETLFLVCIWLAWAALFWTLAWLFAVRRRRASESSRVRTATASSL